MKAALLFLAAGASQRFKGDKRFTPLPGGETLFGRALGLAEECGVSPIFAVDEVASATLTTLHTNSCRAAVADEVQRHSYLVSNAKQGMGATIAESVGAFENQYDSLLIAPIDLPLLQGSAVKAVLDSAGREVIVRPSCHQRAGHPVAFGADFFSQLKTLSGDSGAKRIIQDNALSVIELEVSDAGIYLDMDTHQDYLTYFGQLPPSA